MVKQKVLTNFDVMRRFTQSYLFPGNDDTLSILRRSRDWGNQKQGKNLMVYILM